MAESVALGVGGIDVTSGTHVCTFFSGSSGRDEIVMPYLAEGLRAREKCICVLESDEPSEVLARLSLRADVGPPVASGQLELLTSAEAYLRSGAFSTEEMLGYWVDTAAAMRDQGDFTLARAAGEMPAVLDHPGGRAEFFRYESRLTEVIADCPEVILCLYDLERWGAQVVMDALRTHPLVIVDGMMHDNPYYIEPGRYLAGRG